ncbi:helix-turn-helix domain-containing protein [Seohaeicola saemankumensis]|nr:helix-turn-helix transcriptional regulator [Seohaeicola saemankumensis]MCA0871870.1 helix-turn-helix domain-containing protein [Seohaeicola saemankumensis]
MTKVSPEDLKAFGTAVKRARALRGWTLDQLGAALDPPVGKSLVSKVEKGRKEGLNARTVGRFIKALDLDEGLIDAFLGTDTTDDGDETKAERDADRILDRLDRDEATRGASEDLLIMLANRYAEGTHRELETAYIGVRAALEEFVKMKAHSNAPDNADGQFQAVMAEVTRLNEAGDADAAGEALDEAMARNGKAYDTILQQQLAQDRVRNRPDLTAKRLIKDLHRQAPPGGVVLATDQLCVKRREAGNVTGDMFALQVALELARSNHERARKKQDPAVLFTLAHCHFQIGRRSEKEGHLLVARNAVTGALAKFSKDREPLNWAASLDMLGSILSEMGRQNRDPEKLQQAISAHREALEIELQHGNRKRQANPWNNLGNALCSLAELTEDPQPLQEAIESLDTALALKDRRADPSRWALTKNNLGLAWRWKGALTKDRQALDTAEAAYQDCLPYRTRTREPFKWAMTQWNRGDLALARFEVTGDPTYLSSARTHVMYAREVFAEGSDHQTARCDELLAKIDAAEGK